jgi:hypothetical protein
MKLRLTPDSVRLRLNQTDVAQFAEKEEITERVEFPGAVLRYSLRRNGGSANGTSRFENGELIVTVPEGHAKRWISSEREVGLYYEQEVEGGKPLHLIIEKDFQCIDGPPEEIDPAGYPNPLAGGKHRP